MNKVQLKGAGFDMAVDTGKVKFDKIVVKTSGGVDLYYKGYHVGYIETMPLYIGDELALTGIKGKMKASVVYE